MTLDDVGGSVIKNTLPLFWGKLKNLQKLRRHRKHQHRQYLIHRADSPRVHLFIGN